MQKLSIPHPCNEDFSKMTATERVAFCEKCSVDTYAFYKKSIPEIKSILYQNTGKEICGRFAPGQMEAINAEFEAWTFRSKKSFQSAFAMTLLVVFGLGLFSCADKENEVEVDRFQKATMEIVANFEKDITLKEAGEGFNKELKNTILLWPLTFDFNFGYPFQCSSWSMMPGGVIEYPMNYTPFLESGITFPVPETKTAIDDTIIARDSVSLEEPVPRAELSVIAFPNPTSGTTTLEYKNLEKARYQIDVIDLNGKHLIDVFRGRIDEELFRQEIDLTEYPSGTYLVILSSRKFKEITRIVKN